MSFDIGNKRSILYGTFAEFSGRRLPTIIITRGNRDSATAIRTTTTRTIQIVFVRCGVLCEDGLDD